MTERNKQGIRLTNALISFEGNYIVLRCRKRRLIAIITDFCFLFCWQEFNLTSKGIAKGSCFWVAMFWTCVYMFVNSA